MEPRSCLACRARFFLLGNDRNDLVVDASRLIAAVTRVAHEIR